MNGKHTPTGPRNTAGSVNECRKRSLNIFPGELVYIEVLRQPIVIVNSLTVAKDLFEKRSSIYSDRFDFPMAVDLYVGLPHPSVDSNYCLLSSSGRAGFDWALGLMRYGDKWRRLRKMFHQKFHLTAVTAYTSIQAKHTKYVTSLM
jgi:hypothetical protein